MNTKGDQRESLKDALQEAIIECELSFKALERETGVLRQSLMKFAAGESSLRLDAADKLANFFGITIRRPHWWVFNCKPEDWKSFTPTKRRGAWWTCDMNTRKGDHAFVYVHAPVSAIVGWLRAESDAKHKPNEFSSHPFICNYRWLGQFDVPLRLADLRKNRKAKNLSIVRGGFRSNAGRPQLIEGPTARLLQRLIGAANSEEWEMIWPVS